MFRFIETIHYRNMVLLEDQESISLVSLPSYRELYQKSRELGVPLPELARNGGATVTVVKNDSKHTYHIGLAVCNNDDWYDRDLGQKYSWERAQDAATKNRKFGVFSSTYESVDSDDLLSLIVSTIPVRYLFDNDNLSNVSEKTFPMAVVPLLSLT